MGPEAAGSTSRGPDFPASAGGTGVADGAWRALGVASPALALALTWTSPSLQDHTQDCAGYAMSLRGSSAGAQELHDRWGQGP